MNGAKRQPPKWSVERQIYDTSYRDGTNGDWWIIITEWLINGKTERIVIWTADLSMHWKARFVNECWPDRDYLLVVWSIDWMTRLLKNEDNDSMAPAKAEICGIALLWLVDWRLNLRECMFIPWLDDNHALAQLDDHQLTTTNRIGTETNRSIIRHWLIHLMIESMDKCLTSMEIVCLSE